MRLTLVFIVLFTEFFLNSLYAQITFNGTGGVLIPPGAPGQTVGISQSPCVVSGIGVLGGCNTIANVTIDVEHTWVGDIAIFLVGPGGVVLELSSANGGGGDDFTNTVFTDNAAQFITAGTPPYSGNFRPEGRQNSLILPYPNTAPLGTFTFANTYTGINADGVWNLYVNDFIPLDVGVINSWSITFNSSGTPPQADAGDDVTICQGTPTILTASGGDVFAWSTGSSNPTITVNPTTTTTYTVSVTNPGCGTDTDQVTVTVENASVSIVASPPAICDGETSILTATSALSNFDWSTGDSGSSITVSDPGTYSVEVTSSGGCTASASVNLVVRPKPTVVFSASNTDVCANNCFSFSVNFTGTPPYSLVYSTPFNSSLTQTFNSNSGVLQICPPAGFSGNLEVTALSLTDANCVCVP